MSSQRQKRSFYRSSSKGWLLACASICFANQWISQDILSLSSQSGRAKMDIHWFGWYAWFLMCYRPCLDWLCQSETNRNLISVSGLFFIQYSPGYSAFPAEYRVSYRTLSFLAISSGFTSKEVDSLPFGIATPLREAMYECMSDPPLNLPAVAYDLIGQ